MTGKALGDYMARLERLVCASWAAPSPYTYRDGVLPSLNHIFYRVGTVRKRGRMLCLPVCGCVDPETIEAPHSRSIDTESLGSGPGDEGASLAADHRAVQ